MRERGRLSLTPFGAVEKIGGSAFGLDLGDAKIMLDLGLQFENPYAQGWTQPRGYVGIHDVHATVPNVAGLYSKRALKHCSRVGCRQVRYRSPVYDRVVVSHAHFDHIGNIRFLDPEIPVYVDEAAMTVLGSLQITSSYFKSLGRHLFVKFRDGERASLDGSIIRTYSVAHSVPGAAAFIIETPEGTLVYTGDLRAGPATNRFVRAARDANADILLTEGTNVGQRKQKLTESDVLDGTVSILWKHKCNVVFETHPGRDIDRVESMVWAAQAMGRKYVVEPRTFHLLERLSLDGHLSPKIRLKDLHIYQREGLRRRATWETDLLGRYANQTVSFRDIRNRPRDYLVSLGKPWLNELNDMRLAPGAAFIHSMHEAYDDEEEVSQDVLDTFCFRYGIRRYQLHASGHMSQRQLAGMIEAIAPKTVVPVHTLAGREFTKFAGRSKVVLPRIGKRIVF